MQEWDRTHAGTFPAMPVPCYVKLIVQCPYEGVGERGGRFTTEMTKCNKFMWSMVISMSSVTLASHLRHWSVVISISSVTLACHDIDLWSYRCHQLHWPLTTLIYGHIDVISHTGLSLTTLIEAKVAGVFCPSITTTVCRQVGQVTIRSIDANVISINQSSLLFQQHIAG